MNLPIGMPNHLERNCVLEHLKSQKRFLVWKWIKRNGRWTKGPFQVTGGEIGPYASVNDPSTWGTIDEAYKAKSKAEGIGFTLTGMPGIAAIDLDDVRDPTTGKFLPWAYDLVTTINSYSEITPSQKGARVFGLVPENHPTIHNNVRHPEGGSFEIYQNLTSDRGRFVTFTGDRLPFAPNFLSDISGAIGILNAHQKQDHQPLAISSLRPADSYPEPPAHILDLLKGESGNV